MPCLGTSGSLANLPAASTADLAQQLSELNIAGLNSQQNQSESGGGPVLGSQNQQQSLAGNLQDLGGSLATRQAGLGSFRLINN